MDNRQRYMTGELFKRALSQAEIKTALDDPTSEDLLPPLVYDDYCLYLGQCTL